MQELWNVYHKEVPDFVREMAGTPAMLRLKNIGMHCGCEYTQFANYAGTRPYSRWEHSVGVALIIWNFTHDMAQAVAGLLHDIASPTFAHVVDFLHGDYITQEYTEDGTEKIIKASPELTALLEKYSLTVARVRDYHMYPIADNDSPRLSADRLEYTLGNALAHDLADVDEIRTIYDDLRAGINETGEPELTFCTKASAVRFSWLSLTNSKVYSCDENRFAMQALADILRSALAKNVITEADLYTTEPEIIRKICAGGALSARWESYTRYASARRSNAKPADGYWVNVDAKRRHIDPLVAGLARVTALDSGYRAALDEYRGESYDYWISAGP